MIFLDDIIAYLREGEASQIYITDLVTKKVNGEGVNRIITMINAALADLSIQFDLGQRTCKLLVTPDKRRYRLVTRQARTVNPDGYILDSLDDPFDTDALEIVAVTNANGISYPLNSSKAIDELAWIRQRSTMSTVLDKQVKPFVSPKWGELIVPPSYKEGILNVRYKAAAARLKQVTVLDNGSVGEDTSTVFIDLPTIFETAICYYVVMRLVSPKGTERAGQQVYSESSSYYAKYMGEVDKIRALLNNNSTTADTVTSFELGGFP